jgi:polar amino acid transport system substrate-binding protein
MTRTTKLFSLLGMLALLTFTSCNRTNSNSNEDTQTVYQSVLKNGKIRVGYISYAQSYIVNSDGTHAGIFYEVMEEVAKNLGLKIEYTKEVTWDGMIQDIKDGKIDMVVTGIWPTSQRGKHVDFLEPLFYTPVKAYTYAGNSKFDNNLEAINSENVKISTIDGEMTQIIANMDFPKAKQVPLMQMSNVVQTLLELTSKKADITFVEPMIALEFLAKNPNSIQEVKGIQALRLFPNRMMIPKNQEDFKATLNIALQELINSGFVDKVIDKYETYPGSFYRLQLPYRQ